MRLHTRYMPIISCKGQTNQNTFSKTSKLQKQQKTQILANLGAEYQQNTNRWPHRGGSRRQEPQKNFFQNFEKVSWSRDLYIYIYIYNLNIYLYIYIYMYIYIFYIYILKKIKNRKNSKNLFLFCIIYKFHNPYFIIFITFILL